MELTLYLVETAPYDSLNIIDTVRPHWVLSFVSHGRLLTETNGVRSEVRSGEVMLHPPYIPFSEIAAGPGTHLWIAFDLKVPPNVDLFQVHPVGPVTTIQSRDDYQEAFDRLAGICSEQEGAFRQTRALAVFLELIGQLLDSWGALGSPERPKEMRGARDRFLDVIDYMESHLAERLQRDDLAKLVFLHPGYFDRIFRQAYGISPMQMLRDIRLRHAQRLLDGTEYSLDAIAQACGLGDATYLSKVFRRRYGLSPGVYREGSKKARESYITH